MGSVYHNGNVGGSGEILNSLCQRIYRGFNSVLSDCPHICNKIIMNSQRTFN